MSDLQLEALLTELERGDILAAGTRLGKMSDAQRAQLLKLAKGNPAARSRLQAVLGPKTRIASAARDMRDQLDRTISGWHEVLHAHGPATQAQADQLETLTTALREVSHAVGTSNHDKLREVLEGLQNTELPTRNTVTKALRADVDRSIPGTDGLSTLLRAWVLTEDVLDDNTTRRWAEAHTKLRREGHHELANRAIRVLQLDALRRGDLETVARYSTELELQGDAGDPRQAVIALLERSLLSARQGHDATAHELVSQAVERAVFDYDLQEHARFVEGEVTWLCGDPQGALRLWGQIVKRHATRPAPSGASRAALGIAQAARQLGKRQEEHAAYRVAVRAALQLGHEPLVEQAVMGLGRAIRDAGGTEVDGQLIKMLGVDLPRYPRLASALQNGVIATLPE